MITAFGNYSNSLEDGSTACLTGPHGVIGRIRDWKRTGTKLFFILFYLSFLECWEVAGWGCSLSSRRQKTWLRLVVGGFVVYFPNAWWWRCLCLKTKTKPNQHKTKQKKHPTKPWTISMTLRLQDAKWSATEYQKYYTSIFYYCYPDITSLALYFLETANRCSNGMRQCLFVVPKTVNKGLIYQVVSLYINVQESPWPHSWGAFIYRA